MESVPGHEQTTGGTLSGRILISGTGFLVAAGMWAILGFFRYEGGMGAVAAIDLTLTVLHAIVGIMVFRRVRNSWYIGLAVCGIGLFATLPNHYYFPLGINGVLGILFYLSRPDFPDVAVAGGSSPR